jgi:hypothetical protein
MHGPQELGVPFAARERCARNVASERFRTFGFEESLYGIQPLHAEAREPIRASKLSNGSLEALGGSQSSGRALLSVGISVPLE